jgi:ArsR family transcriptional regulator, arsenate/arsenite/antimonite-responsive transcriptional repressor
LNHAALAPDRLSTDRAVALCRALADPTRLSLMGAIWQAERCVCDLRDASGDPAPNLASHHLAALRRAGLVDARKDGRWVYYRPAADLDEPTAAMLTLLLGPRGDGTAAQCS